MLMKMGTVLVNRGNFDEALKLFEEAAREDPENLDVYLCRCTIHEARKEYQRAIDECTRALAVKPDYSPAYRVRAVNYKRLNQLDRAWPDYQKAIDLEPGRPDYYFVRALARYEQQMVAEALDDFSKCAEVGLAAKSNPVFHKYTLDALQNKVVCLNQLGRQEEADEADKFLEEARKTLTPPAKKGCGGAAALIALTPFFLHWLMR